MSRPRKTAAQADPRDTVDWQAHAKNLHADIVRIRATRGGPTSWADLDWTGPPERLRDQIGRLIAAKTPPDERFEWGDSPLQQACRIGRPEIVADLLASGADHVRPGSSRMQTDEPLSIIAGEDGIDLAARSAILRALVAAGHDPVRARAPVPPLHRAAMSGETAVVDLFLAAGVPADVRDEVGGTALHFCLTPAMVAHLVATGADPNAADDAGIQPLAQQIVWCTGVPARLETAAALAAHGAALRLPSPRTKRGQETKTTNLLVGHGDPHLAVMGRCMAMRAGMRPDTPFPSDPALRAWALEGASAAIHEPWAMRLLAELGAAS